MLYVIVNPASKSGRGQKKWEAFREELNRSSIVYEVFFTKKDSGASKCVADILTNIRGNKAETIICVLGGDGTINEVVNATEGVPGIILAYLPTGSSNDLARALKLTASPKEFLARIKKREICYSDLGTFTAPESRKRHFCVSCGIGLDAAVCKEALSSPLKDTLNHIGLGKLTYAGIALKQLIRSPMSDCMVTLSDGTTHHFDKFLFGAALVHPYEGGGIKMAPMADCHDGKFDLLIVAGLKKWQALYLLPLAFFGKHVNSKNVFFFQCSLVKLETKTPLIVHADGEFCGSRQEITLNCQKNHLKYI